MAYNFFPHNEKCDAIEGTNYLIGRKYKSAFFWHVLDKLDRYLKKGYKLIACVKYCH
jgi:hypothetical protein